MSIKPSIDKIYEEYYQKVFSYINSRINNYHDSEDLCEDVFTKVFRNMEKFDDTKSALGALCLSHSGATSFIILHDLNIHEEDVSNTCQFLTSVSSCDVVLPLPQLPTSISHLRYFYCPMLYPLHSVHVNISLFDVHLRFF